ncbi:MAG: integrase [Proteobacteria bacterium]|nr:integrase [Pseudomonadota bacterium]
MIRKGQIEGIKKGNVKDQVEFIVNLFQIAA